MQEDNSSDPLLSNKIAAAALTALLLIFGLPQLSAALLGGGGHGGESEELHLAYCCVELETGHAEIPDEPAFDLGTALANASIAGGERRAALCKSCHTFDEGGADGTGPNLYNIVNRPVGATAGFNYSTALQELGGVWSYERLDGYLKNSQDYVPGTAMVQRFPKDDQRADLMAYLGSLASSPAAYPEPVVVETAVEEVIEEAAAVIDEGADMAGDKINNALEGAKDAAAHAAESVEDAAAGDH